MCLSVCVSVSDGSGMFVGQDWTIVTCDLHTLIYLLNLELREECSRTLGPGHGLESSMQSGSSSRVKADAIGRAAVEAVHFMHPSALS